MVMNIGVFSPARVFFLFVVFLFVFFFFHTMRKAGRKKVDTAVRVERG